MKTSKRLLSFILAVVMALTACSVGFTALANEVNPQSESVFSAENADAQGSIDALNGLINDYLPVILELIGEDKLASAGINLDAIKSASYDDDEIKSDSFYALMGQLSPVLYGKLGGASKSSILADEHLSFGNDITDEQYYAYLEDEDAAMDFWTLYQLCKDNKNNSNAELKALCNKYLDGYTDEDGNEVVGLTELLYAEKTAYDTAENNFNMMLGFIQDYGIAIGVACETELGFPANRDYTVEEIQALIDAYEEENGEIPLKTEEYDVELFYPFVEYLYSLFEQEAETDGTSEQEPAQKVKINSLAELFYYFSFPHFMLLSGLILIDCLEAAGYDTSVFFGEKLTIDNWYNVLSGLISYEDFLTFGLVADTASEEDKVATYNEFLMMQIMMNVDVESDPELKATMQKGSLIYFGFATAEDVEKYVTDVYFTPEQYAQIIVRYNDRTVIDGTRLKNYINNDPDGLGFSEDLKGYFTNLKAAEAKAYLDKIILFDGTNDPTTEDQRTQFRYYAIDSFAKNFPGKGDYSLIAYQNGYQACADILLAKTNYKYDSSKYPVDSKYMIFVVNSMINKYVNMIKNLNGALGIQGIDINGIVNQVVSALVVTEGPNGEQVTLESIAGNLQNVYMRLAKDPVSTISNLLPLLTILLDEVILPLFLNDDEDAYGNDFIYGMLTNEGELLYNISQDAYNTVNALFDEYGINTFNFDLNYILPATLHYLQGDETLVASYYVNDDGSFVLTDDGKKIPVLFNVQVLDELLVGFQGMQFADPASENGPMINEIVSSLVGFLTPIIDEYVKEHGKDAKIGTMASGDPATINKGLNNLLTALPVLIDMAGTAFLEKYNVDSDWGFDYRILYGTGTVPVEDVDTNFVTVENATLTGLKVHFFDSDPQAADIAAWLVNLLISDWINAVIDLFNDIFSTENDLTTNMPIITALLNSLGGFGEMSIISDVLNGFFGMSRTDDCNFELAERAIPLSTDETANYVGFSEDSAFYLVANVNELVNLIMSIVNANKAGTASLAAENGTKAASGILGSVDFEKIANDYSKIATQKNIEAADKLIEKVDSLLSTLLANTYLDGYRFDQLDSLLSSVITFLHNHLGEDVTNELLALVTDYLTAINAASTKDNGSWNVNSGKDGCAVDAKKVYSKENLSNLVTRTYALVENILGSLIVIKGDYANAVVGAISGVISPSAVAIRSSVINEDIMDCVTWNEISTSRYAKNLGYDNLVAGDKETFYKDLVDSLGAITAIAGALLCTTGYYSNVLEPIVASVCETIGIDYLTGVTEDTSGNDVVYGIVDTLANVINAFMDAPATTLLSLIRGAIGTLDDNTLTGIIDGAIAPIINEVNGLGVIIGNLSSILAGKVAGLADSIGTTVWDAIPDSNILMTLIAGEDAPEFNPSVIKQISNAQLLLIVYTAVVDIVLNSGLIKNLISGSSQLNDLANNLAKLDACVVLDMLTEIISATQNPTEIYWTFSEYVAKETDSFVFPRGINQSKADDAVDSLDELVNNIFPLLQSFGVLNQSNLTEVVDELLFTNDMVTKIATGVYGAIEKAAKGQFVFTPSQLADYLLDSSYGATYTSAAAALKKCSSWSQVKSLNWGFTDGSAKAEQGFINALAALCRPVNDVLAVFLAEGDANIVEIVKGVLKDLNLKIVKNSGDVKLTIAITDNALYIETYNNAAKNAQPNLFKVELIPLLDELSNVKIAGGNGYQSAIIPLLEALMCDGVKTYAQYINDYNKAKDNLLIDILNPLFGFVDDVLEAPFDTLTAVLPNVAYFLDNNGVGQLVNNLLSPITELLTILDKYGINIDTIIEAIAGKSLGELINMPGLNLQLTDLNSCNIQDVIIPLVNSILKNKNINIKLPNIDWGKLASLGTEKVVASAAGGNVTQIIGNQGKVLITVLRYLEDVLVDNAASINKLLGSIEAISKNKTILAVIDSVFAQIGTAKQDEIVLAVFYLLCGDPVNNFFDYTGFKYKDYEFSYPSTVDVDFLTVIGPMLDGLLGGLIEGGLGSLVTNNIYKDSIISSLAVGLYGAIEGVKINDSMNLAQLLAQTDIDFTTGNVAKLLTDKAYGQQYASAAKVIEKAGSWSKVNKDSLSWGVTDRDSFVHALCAVLRPIYGVLDVLLNDGSLGLFNLIYLPGSDGYTSAIVPLMEAFGLYNIKTQYQYREDMAKEYDAILLDILNPLLDKVEDLLNAPIEMLADMLPNLALFFANDGLLQLIENLLGPINALLDAIEPVADVNAILKAVGLDIDKELSKLGLVGSNYHFDIYDLSASLKPLIGADNIVGLLNKILGLIKIGGAPLGIELMPIDWYQLASHGEVITNEASQAATFGGRIYVKADQAEVLIAVLRYLINTVNYKDNYSVISNLIGGLLGGASDSISDVVDQVLGMLAGDTDQVISDLCGLLQTLA